MEVIKGMKDTEKGSKEVTGMEEEKVKNNWDNRRYWMYCMEDEKVTNKEEKEKY